MRKPKNGNQTQTKNRSEGDTHTEVLSSGDIPKGNLEQSEPTVKADATGKSQEVPEAVQPESFQVLEDRVVLVDGHRTKLRAGKVLNAVNYDVERLLRQGVKLKKVDPLEAAAW